MFVYLDTSFLSQFAKVEMGQLGVSSHAEKWGELLARLRQEVQRGTLICPASEFPVEEALLFPKILPRFTHVLSELSKGYFFKVWTDVLVHQTTNEVLIYLGRPQDIDLSWRALTRQNPGFVPSWATRIAKEKAKQFAEELHEQGAPQKSYAEQYEEEKISLLQESFLQPIRQLLGFDTYLKYPDPMLGILIREAKISEQEFPKVLEFFDSDRVDRIPYIHIYCSIEASLRTHEGTRKPKSGDLHDLPALACAMPYCPIVTTDKSMAHIVKSRELDTKYGTEIFTPTTKGIDDLLGKLEAFAQ